MRTETNLIEITVRGGVGRGKSEVIEVLTSALDEFYGKGSRVKVAGKVCKGAIDEAKHTGQTAKGDSTVFVFYEKMAGEK